MCYCVALKSTFGNFELLCYIWQQKSEILSGSVWRLTHCADPRSRRSSLTRGWENQLPFSYNPLPRVISFLQMDLGNEKHRCGESLDSFKDDSYWCLSTCQTRWLQIRFELANSPAVLVSEKGQAQFYRSFLFSFKYHVTRRSKFVQSQNSCKTACLHKQTVASRKPCICGVLWSVVCCLSFQFRKMPNSV